MIDGVSILVICYGRVKLLEDLFISLDAARLACSLPTELVVVDNSKPDDARAIEELCAKHNASYHYAAKSVAIKRNICAEYAKYSLLYYCDSDCVVTENILNEHIAQYENESVGAVSGPVILQGKENSLIKTLSETSWCDAFTQPLKYSELHWGTTANFSVLKEVFEASGGFNEEFPNKPGGEDVDIGFRICDTGYIIKSAPEAVVYHSNKTWLNVKEVATRLFSYGRSNVLVAKSHPNRLIADVNWLAVWLLMAVLFSALAIWRNLVILWILPITFFSHMLLTVTWKAIAEKRGFFKILLIESLSLVECIGTFAGCFKYKTLIPLYRQVMYSKYQEHGTFPDNQRKYLILFAVWTIGCVLTLVMI